MPRTERDNAKWLQRRDEIVDAAARLFAANGFHATGVAELGEHVGLARGALYYYIESKDTLLRLIHDRVLEEICAAGDAAIALEASPADQLAFLGREVVRIVVDQPDHLRVFLHESRSLHGDAAASARDRQRGLEDRIERILVSGCRRGEFTIDDTRLAALGWWGLHRSVYTWIGDNGDYSAETVADHLARIFLIGIARG